MIAPAIVMIVLNAIGILLMFFGICSSLFSSGYSNSYYQQYGLEAPSPVMNIVWSLMMIGAGAFAIYGLWKMKKAESYNLSLAAVIVSMVPCVGPCCGIGTLVGIWPLVVMLDNQVKASFRS